MTAAGKAEKREPYIDCLRGTAIILVVLGHLNPGLVLETWISGITALPFGIPEILACSAVVLLHLWKRNTLLSIISGTALYMVLVQIVI